MICDKARMICLHWTCHLPELRPVPPRKVLTEDLALRSCGAVHWLREMIKRSPFRYFETSPEIIRLAVMLYIRFPLSLRNVEDLLHERGIEISHETVRY